MTIKEFQISLQKKANDIKLFAEPLRFAAFDVTAKMGNRIFDNGMATDNSKIGEYSTKPIYVNPDTLYKKGLGVPRGKNGETKFKTGKKTGQPHKTKYLEGGYKQLRNMLGNRIDIVDLTLSHELRMDFSNDQSIAEPRKIDDLEYQIRLDKDINQKKRGGIEKKYGEIFSLSESEKEVFFNTINFKFREALAK